MNKRFACAMLAGAAIVGCTSQPAGPRFDLQHEFPEARVIGIGQMARTNDNARFESKAISVKSYDELTYPPRALNQGRAIEGCVVIELLVDKDGSIQRTSVAEAYPRGYFNKASLREARKFRFPASGEKMITYHLFVYKVDQTHDSGLEEITRSPGYTELLHLNSIPTDPGIPEGYTGYTSRLNDGMPKACAKIGERYVSPAIKIEGAETTK